MSNLKRQIEVFSPLDGSSLGHIPASGPEEIDAAVKRSAEAFASWSATPVKERVQPLYRFKHLVEKHLAEIAQIVSIENGKTPAEASAGVERGLEVVEFACSLPQLF